MILRLVLSPSRFYVFDSKRERLLRLFFPRLISNLFSSEFEVRSALADDVFCMTQYFVVSCPPVFHFPAFLLSVLFSAFVALRVSSAVIG